MYRQLATEWKLHLYLFGAISNTNKIKKCSIRSSHSYKLSFLQSNCFSSYSFYRYLTVLSWSDECIPYHQSSLMKMHKIKIGINWNAVIFVWEITEISSTTLTFCCNHYHFEILQYLLIINCAGVEESFFEVFHLSSVQASERQKLSEIIWRSLRGVKANRYHQQVRNCKEG